MAVIMTTKTIGNNGIPNAIPVSSTSPDKPLIDEKVSQVARNVIEKSNGDMRLPPDREAVYSTMDGTATFRNGFSLVHSIAEFIQAHAQLTQAATVVATFGTAIAFGLLFTGLLYVGTGLKWTLSDAIEDLVKAEKELRDEPANEEKEETVRIETLGVANQYLYTQTGVVQILNGIVTLMSSPAAHLMHYAPVLVGPAAVTAALV